jgi:REP element-mobilizing transposase RayT
VTRCVRRAFLLGEGATDRKLWIEHRLRELAEIFGVAVGGFSVLDNHLHLLVRLDPDVAQGWSDEDVVRRWGRLFPPRDK